MENVQRDITVKKIQGIQYHVRQELTMIYNRKYHRQLEKIEILENIEMVMEISNKKTVIKAITELLILSILDLIVEDEEKGINVLLDPQI